MVATAGVLIDRCAEDPAERVQRDDAWEATLSGLTTTRRCVVALRHRHGLNHVEIGVVLGLTPERVCQIYRETLVILRQSGNYRALER